MVGDKKSLNLVLIFTGGDGFPIGGAYTNRVMAFAKGFVENNCNVTIMIIYPGKNNLAEIKGSMDGFDYIVCAGLKRPKNWFVRKIIGIKGIFNSVRNLNSLNKKAPVDAIMTFSQNFSQNFPLYLYTRIHKIIFIRENNEFPRMVLKRGHSQLSLLEKAFFKFVNRFYDGFVYISSNLFSFNVKMLRKQTPVEIVPIIVDKERFNFLDLQRKNWITYCGNLFGEKDGVKILLEAFSIIYKNHPDYKLMLVGNSSNKIDYKDLQKFIKDKGIQSKVEFTGFVHRDKIPELLFRSSVLVLARPNNIQAKGGFPTKLGEYLATGRPILVTSVSDIPKYIKDGVNGYLAKPDSLDDFAKKLDWILSNYHEAEKVGLEGQKLTEKEFNIVYQSARVIDFIDRIKGEQMSPSSDKPDVNAFN